MKRRIAAAVLIVLVTLGVAVTAGRAEAGAGPIGGLEVCAQAGDQYVPRSPPGSPHGWRFTIWGNGMTPIHEHVLSGQCSADVYLGPGQ